MKWPKAIDAFMDAMRAAGRINSVGTERAYRDVLGWHAEDAEAEDPRKADRDDVRRTLRRWTGNTQANRHSILAAFYRWLVQEGYRKDNPADQLPRARKRKPDPPRLRQDEALAMLAAAETVRERRVLYLGVLAGVRNQEMRRLRGKHFDRPGWIRIAPDVGKGGRPRWLPILDELVPVVDEIRANVGRDEFVVPAQRRDPNAEVWYDVADLACSGQAVWRLVRRVADRAGVDGNPHALRRAFADLIEKQAGVRMAQKLLGHASLSTTEDYLSEPTLDELQGAVEGVSLAPNAAQSSARSKLSTVPSSSEKTTSRSSTPTVASSASMPSWPSTVTKSAASIHVPPRGFEPRVSAPSHVEALSGLFQWFWGSPALRLVAREMGR